MLKLLTTYFLTLITILGLGQSADTFKISGIVVSTVSNRPISEALIEFTRAKGVLSDSNGHFVINKLSAGQYKLSFSALGYDSNDTLVTIAGKNITEFVFNIHTDCYAFPQVNKELALKDIQDGKPKLLLVGGIAPIVYTTDKHFEKKYKVYFSDYGCTPGRQECMLAYNKTIFEYLDKTYGTKWRKEVRQDVIGLHDE